MLSEALEEGGGWLEPATSVGPYFQCKAALQHWLVLHLPDVQAFELNLLQCSLHSIKSEETREVNRVSTKTRRDVGMVSSASEDHTSLHEKLASGKTAGTRRKTIQCPTHGTIRRRGTIPCLFLWKTFLLPF